MENKEPDKKRNKETESNPPENKASVTDSPPKRNLWKIVAIAFIAISIVLLLYAYNCYNEISMYDENLVNCSLELEEALMEKNNKDAIINKLERDAKTHGLGDVTKNALPDSYIQKFKDKGLSSPENIIKNDLYHRYDLIPYEAPGNIAFRFNDRRLIYLLSPKRAFANFSAGDVKGWVFLSYKVKANSEISWKVLESYCPDLDK